MVEFVLVLKHSKRTAPVVALSLGVSYGEFNNQVKGEFKSKGAKQNLGRRLKSRGGCQCVLHSCELKASTSPSC